MKRIIPLLAAVIFLFAAIPVSAAYDPDALQELYRESGMEQASDRLDDTTRQLLEGIGLDPDAADEWAEADLSEFWKLFWEQCREKFRQPLILFAALIGMMLLSVILRMLGTNDTTCIPLDLYYTVCCAGILGKPMVLLLQQAKTVFETAGSFMEAFMPAYAGIYAVLGQSNAAFGMQTVTFGTAQIVTALMTQIMLPVISVCMALCFVSGAGDLLRTDQIAAAISKAASFVLGLVMSFFTLTLSVQRIIAQTAETLGLKTAKLALSTFVPVVGGQLSDALSSVTVCMRMLGSTAGGFASAALAILFLPLLLSILSMLLLSELGVMTAALLHLDAAGRIFSSLASGLGLLFGVTLCAAAAMIIAMTLLAFTVGG